MQPLFANSAPLFHGASEHERRIREHFGDNIANGQRNSDGLETTFIVFTNRSGSNLLAEFLWTTGQFNQADESLNWDIVLPESTRHGYKTFADYLVAKSACAVNGHYAIKASIYQYSFLDRVGLLDALFPRRRILLSERLDKVEQAVSWLIATQTQAWTSRQRPLVAPESVKYDRRTIVSCLKRFQSTHQDAELYFNLRGEPFCRVVYEDLVEAPDLTMARVMRFLGAPELTADPAKIQISKQSSGLNEQFRRRFLREVRDAGQ